jgi:leucyl aminopeptidase (aminopeptidase T)
MPESVSPADLSRAALVLVSSALHVKQDERFVVVCDAESQAIGAALAAAGESAGALVTVARLDQLPSADSQKAGDRPHKVLPDALRRALLAAQASVFVASQPHQELGMREQLLHIVSACNVRHAQLPALTQRAFAAGMRLDYDKVETWGRGVARLLELARAVDADSAAGTKLRAVFPPDARWNAQLGTITPGRFALFPAGALLAPPESVEGVFVANASLGEFFGAREGLLLERPVKLTIQGGRVTRVEAPHSPALLRDLETMLAVAPNSDRVGLVAIGANVGIGAPTGDANVDVNLPSLHLIIGDPAGRANVAWTARTSFAACSAGTRVAVDGSVAMADGKIISVG